jgi:hypothetical protein
VWKQVLLAVLLTASCKRSGKAKPVEPHVSAFAPLPAAGSPVADPPESPPAFPPGPPTIVVWRGGGEPPKTELSIRVWNDGRVRYTCGKGATLPPERVTEMVAAFEKAGWNPATAKENPPPDSQCVSTSVQLGIGLAAERRDSGCGPVPYEVQDAVDFVQSVVGPAPC